MNKKGIGLNSYTLLFFRKVSKMKVNEWIKEVHKLDTKKLTELQKAFDTIMQWDRFKTEYSHQGIEILKTIIEIELTERK